MNYEKLLQLDGSNVDVAPNEVVHKKYNTLTYLLQKYNVPYSTVSLYVEGGVTFTFKNGNYVTYVELYNDGEQGYTTYNTYSVNESHSVDTNSLRALFRYVQSFTHNKGGFVSNLNTKNKLGVTP